MIFLDTDIIIEYFHGNQSITEHLLNETKKGTQLCTSAITVFELYKGLLYLVKYFYLN